MILKARLLTLGLIAAASVATAASKNPMVGGQEMLPNKNIIENAVNSADHTTLVAAVKAAGLVETLQGPGPFTVFAPTNSAFAKLPDSLTAVLDGDKLVLLDEKGDRSMVTIANVYQSNGVIHVIDTVVLPN